MRRNKVFEDFSWKTIFSDSAKLIAILVVLILFVSPSGRAQNDSLPVLDVLQLEARADVEVNIPITDTSEKNLFGFKGRYFNFKVAGNLGKHFSYYFRQRMVANPGSVVFFDNTDFLYLDYKPNVNWRIRLGKDALAVGGYEYDATPIDVLFSTYYWDNFYCFQIAASVAYISKDKRNTIVAQVGNSPYVHTNSNLQNSLLSYNLQWCGRFGPFHTSYSFNMFERERGKFMNYIALGNELVFNKWDFYLDFIHHATSTKALMKNFAVVACANAFINDYFSMFAKVGYEQNLDRFEAMYYVNPEHEGQYWDCLSFPGMQSVRAGIGFEFKPKSTPDIRIHVIAADYCSRYLADAIASGASSFGDVPMQHRLAINGGVTWHIDFLQFRNKKL